MDKPRVPLFYKVAIIFSLLVNVVLVLVLVLAVIFLPGILRPILSNVIQELDGLENAVIRTTVVVDQAMPVRDVDIEVQEAITVKTVDNTDISSAPITFYPAGGGSLPGTAAIRLPPEVRLPIGFENNIVMSSTIPVKLAIPVEIPLKDTQVGTFAANLKAMLEPIVKLVGIR